MKKNKKARHTPKAEISRAEGLGTLHVLPSELILSILSELSLVDRLKMLSVSHAMKDHLEATNLTMMHAINALQRTMGLKNKDPYLNVLDIIRSQAFYQDLIQKPILEMNTHEIILFLFTRRSFAELRNDQLWEIKEALQRAYEDEILDAYHEDILQHINIIDLFLQLNYFSRLDANRDDNHRAIEKIIRAIENLLLEIKKPIALHLPRVSFSFVETDPTVKINLANVSLPNSNFYKVDLENCSLSHLILTGVNLSFSKLSNAVLDSVDLTEANLIHVDLSGSTLKGVSVFNANLTHSDLSDAQLAALDARQANLSKADLSESNLSSSNFTDAILNGASLIETNFEGANLTRTDLRNTNLTNVKLKGAILDRTRFIDTAHIQADLTRLNTQLFHSNEGKEKSSNKEIGALRLVLAKDLLLVLAESSYSLNEKDAILKKAISHPIFQGPKTSAINKMGKFLPLDKPLYASESQKLLKDKRKELKTEEKEIEKKSSLMPGS